MKLYFLVGENENIPGKMEYIPSQNPKRSEPIIPDEIVPNLTSEDEDEIFSTLVRCLPSVDLKEIDEYAKLGGPSNKPLHRYSKWKIPTSIQFISSTPDEGDQAFSVYFSEGKYYIGETAENDAKDWNEYEKITEKTFDEIMELFSRRIRELKFSPEKRKQNVEYFGEPSVSYEIFWAVHPSETDITVYTREILIKPKSKKQIAKEKKKDPRLVKPEISNFTGVYDISGNYTVLLFKVPFVNDIRHGVEERWFFCGDQPGALRYWISGREVSKKDYENALKTQITAGTSLINDLSGLTAQYLTK